MVGRLFLNMSNFLNKPSQEFNIQKTFKGFEKAAETERLDSVYRVKYACEGIRGNERK